MSAASRYSLPLRHGTLHSLLSHYPFVFWTPKTCMYSIPDPHQQPLMTRIGYSLAKKGNVNDASLLFLDEIASIPDPPLRRDMTIADMYSSVEADMAVWLDQHACSRCRERWAADRLEPPIVWNDLAELSAKLLERPSLYCAGLPAVPYYAEDNPARLEEIDVEVQNIMEEEFLLLVGVTEDGEHSIREWHSGDFPVFLRAIENSRMDVD